MSKIERDIQILENKARFIMMVVENRIRINNVKKE
jgi:hypothetical protein